MSKTTSERSFGEVYQHAAEQVYYHESVRFHELVEFCDSGTQAVYVLVKLLQEGKASVTQDGWIYSAEKFPEVQS